MKMKINGNKYGFSIMPTSHGTVYAEIYRLVKSKKIIAEDTGYLEILVINKEFGGWLCFGTVKSKDYKKAREWVELHLKNIYLANR